MIELPTPIFDNLFVPQGAYGLESPQKLIDKAIGRFTQNHETSEVISVSGVPLSGKSRVLTELPVVIKRQPIMLRYEQEIGAVPIHTIEFDTALKRLIQQKGGNREYFEEEYVMALEGLVQDVEKVLSLMQAEPGILLIGYVAVTDLRVDSQLIGYQRGGVALLEPLAKHTGIFSNLRYSHSSLVFTSDDGVKKLGHRARALSAKAGLEEIQAVAAEMQYLGDPRELGGAHPGIAETEGQAMLSPILKLWELGKIKLPKKSESWENVIREYLPFYFSNLGVPKSRVVTPLNRKL